MPSESDFDGYDMIKDAPPVAPLPDDRSVVTSSSPRLIQSSAEFVGGFTPPDYLVDGVLQRRYCYSLTATTGTGKTAIMLRTAAHVCLGRQIGDRDVAKGRVLYFAGENPDDIRARWIALAQEMVFDPEEAGVYFIAGVYKISETQARIRQEMEEIGGEFSLIVVDTSAAYFEGDQENDNTQHGAHARRLRALCKMPGGPCVLVACHPPKNAKDDNLQPRGGGAFLAEIDGNLTARKNDGAVALHWQGKFRGPEFPEILFGLRTITHSKLRDSRGRLMPTVIAYPMGDEAREEMAATARLQEDQLLLKLAEKPQASFADLASALGWKLKTGEPHKMMVSRTFDALKKANLVRKERGKYTLTPTGVKEVEKLKTARATP
jgi:hypothetical protein